MFGVVVGQEENTPAMAAPDKRSDDRLAVGPDLDQLLAPLIAAALEALDGSAPLLSGMVRYHLGLVDQEFKPLSPEETKRSQGKRLRPAIALLSAGAVGGRSERAAPLAAAVELLHQFTLIHDDIQDESPTRRHRPTVWKLWGVGQAINAGDALFAAAHLALYRLREVGIPTELTSRLAEAYDRMTIEIVRGQVLDLGFEGRNDVTPAAYLDMIAGKTSAIVAFAAWGGALLGGANEMTAQAFSQFGRSLGLGFQIQDDFLGIWGREEDTGKVAADDIRRRKQSLPILMLREVLHGPYRAETNRIFAAPTVDEAGVNRVLELLDAHGIPHLIEDQVRRYHDDARAALDTALAGEYNAAASALLDVVDRMAARDR
jgi:geranylgeranyl diphosphate synthase type I